MRVTLDGLFEDGPDEPGAVGASPVATGWAASAQVIPVAVVSFVGMCLPVVAAYGRIPITTALHSAWFAGWAVSWVAIVVAWLVGLIGVVAGVAASIAARRRGWTVVIVITAIVLGGAAVVQHTDPSISPKAYHWVHRDDFDAIARFAHDGAIAELPAGNVDGAVLPPKLRGYSATGRILTFGGEGPTPAFFVPVALGWRGGAIGFAYSADGPPTAADAQAELPPGQIRVAARLGGDWWWMEAA